MDTCGKVICGLGLAALAGAVVQYRIDEKDKEEEKAREERRQHDEELRKLKHETEMNRLNQDDLKQTVRNLEKRLSNQT